MGYNEYSFKTLPPHLKDTDTWPAADIENATEEQQSRYLRFMRGIKLYLKGGKLTKAAQEAQCCRSVLLDQLNRCLRLSSDGTIVGWAALISYQRLQGYVRKAETKNPDLSGVRHRGLAGAFEQFLNERSDLREVLHKIIRNGGVLGAVKTRKPSRRDTFKTFKTYCLSERGGMKEGEYPWQGKSFGRRSVERYIARFIEHDASAAKTWLGAIAAQVAPLGSGIKQFDLNTAPLDSVQFDSHKIDCMGTVIIMGPKGPQPIVIKRLWLCGFGDTDSGTLLGLSPAIATEIDAGDIIRAARTMTEPWHPKALPEGLRYLPGACLPSGNVEGLEQCRPCMIQFDNAAQHYSHKVLQQLRRALGCVLTFNPVGGWWRNAVVERLFQTLEDYGFQKLPSAVASANKGAGDVSPGKAAQHNGITWEVLVALVDVVAANFNVTNSQRIGNRKPIEYLQWRLALDGDEFLPRLPPPVSASSPKLGIVIEMRPVGGSSEKNKLRAPYIEIDKVRHACPQLKMRRDLIGKHVSVHIDEDDMRSVDIYEESGRFIGSALPQKEGWRQTKHTRQMRKHINQLIDVGLISDTAGDVVLEYLQHLAKKPYKHTKKQGERVSNEGTKLAEAIRDAGLKSDAVRPRPKKVPLTVSRPMPAHIPRPNWKAR